MTEFTVRRFTHFYPFILLVFYLKSQVGQHQWLGVSYWKKTGTSERGTPRLSSWSLKSGSLPPWLPYLKRWILKCALVLSEKKIHLISFDQICHSQTEAFTIGNMCVFPRPFCPLLRPLWTKCVDQQWSTFRKSWIGMFNLCLRFFKVMTYPSKRTNNSSIETNQKNPEYVSSKHIGATLIILIFVQKNKFSTWPSLNHRILKPHSTIPKPYYTCKIQQQTDPMPETHGASRADRPAGLRLAIHLASRAATRSKTHSFLGAGLRTQTFLDVLRVQLWVSTFWDWVSQFG